MDKKYQVFVSSTYEDLKAERAAVITALLKAGYIPTGMEYFTASSTTQWEVIEKIIPQCDYYIVIVAGKYGSIEPTSGISYTEKEYDHAVRSGVPVIAFPYSNVDNLPNKDVEKEPAIRVKLDAFREKVKTHMADFWDNKDKLAMLVLAALQNEINNNPRTGWVRADSISERKPEVDYSFLDTVADLHIEHSNFSFEENDTVVEKVTLSLQWGEILEKVSSKLTTPLTFQGAKEEISDIWGGIVEGDVQLIINTFVNKGILEVGSRFVEGLGVQNYCTVTAKGHQVLAEYLTKTNGELALRDRRLLVKILNCFSTRLMDEYVKEGPAYFDEDLLTSFEMCDAIVCSSSFVFYGETLNMVWKPFYDCWREAMNHGSWYYSNNNGKYKFGGLEHDRFVTEQDENNYNLLVANCNNLHRAYMDFIGYVKNTYKIDVEESSSNFEKDLWDLKNNMQESSIL